MGDDGSHQTKILYAAWISDSQKRATVALGLVSIKYLIECTVQRDKMKNDKQGYICFFKYAFFNYIHNIVYVYNKTKLI